MTRYAILAVIFEVFHRQYYQDEDGVNQSIWLTIKRALGLGAGNATPKATSAASTDESTRDSKREPLLGAKSNPNALSHSLATSSDKENAAGRRASADQDRFGLAARN